ncbi:wall-associated receptor kinase 2-like isoform X1 [Musa acuminata AAA Group]|uniref:wall-associated receptor kinase 2-like isoform X1 n=1 Tax=Musa acuminata AAA Group TaxID=214697 RepID=UPI0031E1AFE1
MGVLLGYHLVQLLMLSLVGAAASAADALPGCRTRCGEVDVPYPFGIGPSCSREGFSLDCNTTDDGLEKLFLSVVEITDISLPLGQARMLNEISWQCYNASTNSIYYSTWFLNLTNTPYRFSDDLNKFTVIGCDTLAYIGDFERADSYQSGCVSTCHNEVSLVNRSLCSGIGCCQTSIPKDLTYYEVWFDSDFNSSSTWNFSDCSYAVLLEANQFEFLTSYITTYQFWNNNNGKAPLVVDWAIGNEICEVAQRNITSYACISEHSECLNSSNGPGYLCNCLSGYHGNPYVAHGCQDIDECSDKDQYPCHGTCKNLPGSYNCFCPPGTHGDAFNGTCTQQQKLQSSAKVTVDTGTGNGLIFLLIFGMCIYMIF